MRGENGGPKIYEETPEIVDGTNRSHRGEGRAADKTATLLNVSTTSTKRAAQVLKSGDKSLVAAVTAGEVSLDAAAAVVELPKEEQQEAVRTGRVKERAKAIRKKKAASKPKPEPKPTAKRKAAKAADPEPAAPVDDHAATPDDEETDQLTEDDDPLLTETHAAIDDDGG